MTGAEAGGWPGRLAGGVVVGSALVERCERAVHGEAALDAAEALVRKLKGETANC